MAIGKLPGYITAVQNYAAAKPKVVAKPKPYNPLAYVPGGSSPAVARAIQTQGFAMPNPVAAMPSVAPAIPSASAYVQPNNPASALSPNAQASPASAAFDPYGDALRSDEMYGLGQKNYQDALTMGERTMLSDPINRLIQAYGYDPRTTGSLGSLASKYLDPTGLDAARKAGYTTSQQIERSFGHALAGVPTDLGMSGLQHSGSSAIIGDRLNYERGLSDKNAIDQLLQGIGTANQNWTDFQDTQANTWRQAQENIATRLAAMQGYHGPATDTGGGDTGGGEPDYSGGAEAAYQPAPDVGRLMQADQGAGQWDSWTAAMNNQATKPAPAPVYKPAPATAKLIQKMRQSGEMSAWEKAMQRLGG